jgi:DsbC/DsbD-like thiol-disulfide interchange protein
MRSVPPHARQVGKVIGEAPLFFHIGSMWLRFLPALLIYVLSAAAPQAEQKPFHVSLVGDRFDGKAWHTGVLISLEPGWKTYWRMPGEAGVPPEFTWSTSVPAEVDVLYPTPARHADQSGEAVGYDTEVLFPVTVQAADATSVDVKLDLFFGVCKDICIPATAEATVSLGPLMKDIAGAARVDDALSRIPASGKAVAAAELVTDGGKPQLVLKLNETPDDIFVEAPGAAYVHAPAFSPDGREARLAVDNLKDPAKLSGAALKLTYSRGGQGFEQTVKLP